MKRHIKNILRPYYHRTKSILKFFPGLYKYYKAQELTEVQRKFAETLNFFRAKHAKGKDNGIVLVQMVKDYEYTPKLAAASKVIAEKNNLTVHFYDPYIKRVDYRNLSRTELLYKEISERLGHNQILNIYQHFGGDLIFRNSQTYSNQQKIKEKQDEIIEQIRIKGIGYLPDLEVDNIRIGDLIYDYYMRLYHQPTIEKINPDLLLVVECALNIFYSFNELLKTRKIKYLISTYSAYISHGIPARVCLYNNIEVYLLGSYSYIIQKMTHEFPYHSINHTLFSPDKNLSEEQRELAKNTFTARFSGKIDAATSYMKRSAFTESALNPELKKQFSQGKRNLVIYAHDFYDSPHVNRMLQFPDFYLWLKHTLQALTDLEDLNVFIKPHPNGVEGCIEKTIELTKSFRKDHFIILDETVSNLNIIDLKPDLVVTARGTVCIEMAYFGIPTVALYDNSYANFNFVHTCMSKEEYFAIIRGEKQPVIDFDKEKIISFYYQAFMEQAARGEGNIIDTLAVNHLYSDSERYLIPLLSSDYAAKRKQLLEYYTSALNY